MRELSERELRHLSNYLYVDKGTDYGTIRDAIDLPKWMRRPMIL